MLCWLATSTRNLQIRIIIRIIIIRDNDLLESRLQELRFAPRKQHYPAGVIQTVIRNAIEEGPFTAAHFISPTATD